jgi:hypothetical protein
MNYSTAEYHHGYGLPPGWIWFVLVFLVAAVLVVRSRPAWLLRFWLGGWLVGVAITLIWLDPSYLRYEPIGTIYRVVLMNAIPTGLVALWLNRTRRHVALSRAAVQLASALVVFVCGLMLMLVVAEFLETLMRVLS